MWLANVLGTLFAALAVFVVGGGLMFWAFSSFVWVLGAGTAASRAVGGDLVRGLVATPFVHRLKRLLERD